MYYHSCLNLQSEGRGRFQVHGETLPFKGCRNDGTESSWRFFGDAMANASMMCMHPLLLHSLLLPSTSRGWWMVAAPRLSGSKQLHNVPVMFYTYGLVQGQKDNV